MAHLYCCVVVPHLLPELSSLPLLVFLMCSQNQESRGFVTELGYLSDLKKKADEVVGVLVCLCAPRAVGVVSECVHHMCTTPLPGIMLALSSFSIKKKQEHSNTYAYVRTYICIHYYCTVAV